MKTREEIVFGIDFDGTCVEHKYPYLGKDVPHAVRVMKRIISAGHLLVLNTMRSDFDDSLKPAVSWFDKNELPLFGVNNNPDQNSWTKSTKTYANIYIDDAALGCPLVHVEGQRPYVDWIQVEFTLERLGII